MAARGARAAAGPGAVLMNNAEGDPEGQARAAAFRQGLEALGWTEGKNLRIDWPLIDGATISSSFPNRTIALPRMHRQTGYSNTGPSRKERQRCRGWLLSFSARESAQVPDQSRTA